MTLKRRTYSNRNKYPGNAITNPELDKHRRAFLGNPGSKKWQEYHSELLKAKRRLFAEESIQDREETNERIRMGNKRKTFRNGRSSQDGGAPVDSGVPAAVAIAASLPSTTVPPATNISAAVTVSTTAQTSRKRIAAALPPPNPLASVITQIADSISKSSVPSANPNANVSSAVTSKTPITVTRETPIPVTSKTPNTVTSKTPNTVPPVNGRHTIANTPVPSSGNGVPVDSKRNVPRSSPISVPASRVKAEEIRRSDGIQVVQDDEPRVCGAPMGWLVDLFGTKDMERLLEFAQKHVDAKTIKPHEKWIDPQKPFDATKMLENVITNEERGPCKAEDIKIQYIPFFLQVYMQLIATLKELVQKEKTNDIFNNLRSSFVTTQTENGIMISPKSKGPTTDVTKGPTTDVTKGSTTDVTEERTSKVRKMILFNINLLRNMNMYANPMFFDDLYYYYYFLSLDKILPNMDEFFRMFDIPPKPKKKNNSKVNVKMRVYEQFPNDDPKKEAQEEHHYGYEMQENITGANPETNFDWFLNLVQLHPDFYYNIPVVAETQKDYIFEELSIGNKSDGQNDVKLQIVDPPAKKKSVTRQEQTGGGLFDSVFSVLGMNGTGSYRYLDDNPLAREFQDILNDENDVYDGNVNLCIYSLDWSCDFDGNGPTPFLKFITVKNGDKWGFPSFHYKSLTDLEQNESAFKCEMFNALMSSLNLHLCSDGKKTEEIQASPPLSASQALTESPIQEPIQTPTESPIQTPTEAPIQAPTEAPIQTPTEAPIQAPTEVQTQEPIPIQEPIQTPTEVPTQEPTEVPTQEQNVAPVQAPSDEQKFRGGDPQIDPIKVQEGQPEQEQTSIQEEQPAQEQTSIQEQTPVQEEKSLSPDINAKQNCTNLESALESVYTGLVSDGTRQLFAFLNYDLLVGMIETPENKAQSGLVFCTNTDSSESEKHEHKWGTVDELIFEQKIGEEGVDPTIRETFAKHKNLWNIVNDNDEYIDFPFVVYALEKDESNKLQTIKDGDGNPVKLEKYGTSDTDVDEYDDRYCFSLKPILSDGPGKRYAMFAWRTRYILPESGSESDAPVPEAPAPETPVPETPVPESGSDAPEYETPATETPAPETPAPETPESGSEAPAPEAPKKGGAPDESDKKMDIEIFDIHLKSPGPLQLEEKPEEKESDSEDKTEMSEEDKDRFENEKLNFPTIYIITKNEQTNNEPIVTWGILNPKQFTAI